MTLRSDDRIIDGTRFITTSLPVLDGLVLWAQLGKLAAPALSKLRSVDATGVASVLARLGKLEELDAALAGDIFAAFGPALTELFAKLEPATMRALARSMLASTTAIVDGVKLRFADGDVAIDAAFGDRFGTFMKVLFWVGRHNFQSFSSAPHASIGGAQPAVSR